MQKNHEKLVEFIRTLTVRSEQSSKLFSLAINVNNMVGDSRLRQDETIVSQMKKVIESSVRQVQSTEIMKKMAQENLQNYLMFYHCREELELELLFKNAKENLMEAYRSDKSASTSGVSHDDSWKVAAIDKKRNILIYERKTKVRVNGPILSCRSTIFCIHRTMTTALAPKSSSSSLFLSLFLYHVKDGPFSVLKAVATIPTDMTTMFHILRDYNNMLKFDSRISHCEMVEKHEKEAPPRTDW